MGLVRKIDKLGRIVVPIEWRRQNGLIVGETVEMVVAGEELVIRKSVSYCGFCHAPLERDAVEYQGKSICRDCLEKLKRL